MKENYRQGKINFRFAIVSDGHFGEPGSDDKRHYDNLVKWLKIEREKKGLDVWFFNGDLTHDNPKFIPEVHLRLKEIESPLYALRGNHDLVLGSEWEEYFGMSDFFELEIDDKFFISCPTFDANGHYQCADAGWLEEKLQKGKRFRYVFVFLHICMGGWTREGIFCPEIIALLEKYPITAVFHGHDHLEDGMIKKERTSYFFTGSIGSKWGLSYKGFRIVEIRSDHTVITYQYDPMHKKIVNSNHINSYII